MKIGEQKLNRIREEILWFLYRSSPKLVFTNAIASELARDEEFIKSLLLELEKKRLVAAVRKNSAGASYTRRIRWRLTSNVYRTYKSIEEGSQKFAVVR